MTKRILVAFVILLCLVGAVFAGLSLTHHVQLPLHKTSKPTYLVALGDSVTAGDGLPLVGGTNTAVACARSSEAYPVLLAYKINAKLAQFACSGAKATTGILEPQVIGKQTVPAQLAAAKPYIKGNDVVLTIGANDVDWGSMLIACAKSDCMTNANLTVYQQRLSQLQSNLNHILQTISAYRPHTIVVNTYYSLVSNTDTCLAPYGISSATIAWVNARETDLNSVIAAAAQRVGAKSVHINFEGHMLCSSDPWLQNLSDNAPLHPTAAGQQYIAEQDAQVF